jgi:hypothetical protein
MDSSALRLPVLVAVDSSRNRSTTAGWNLLAARQMG